MPSRKPLLDITKNGLYCAQGGFYLDPWNPVDRAVISHSHSDHLRWGSKHYLTAKCGERIARTRLGEEAQLDCLEYGESLYFNGVKISFAPAGHILGSSQIRVEHDGEVWVFSGDYKIENDPTCETFEPIKCHTFITESTFGLPIYRWQPEGTVLQEINQWWRKNQAAGRASLVTAYPLGKSQRILAGVDASIGPIFTHGSVERINRDYRSCGVRLPKTSLASLAPKNTDWSRAMIVAPPSAHATPWSRRFGAFASAFVSGWMQIRGTRRRRAVDRGFTLSDHVDWPGLQSAIKATGAERIWVTHGYVPEVTRWLGECGYEARGLSTQFEGELDSGEDMQEDIN